MDLAQKDDAIFCIPEQILADILPVHFPSFIPLTIPYILTNTSLVSDVSNIEELSQPLANSLWSPDPKPVTMYLLLKSYLKACANSKISQVRYWLTGDALLVR